jgi:hypothetical protein
MGNLRIFLDRYVRYAQEFGWDPQRAYDQAFGGLQLFIELNPELEVDICELWYDEYKPLFEKLVYGV